MKTKLFFAFATLFMLAFNPVYASFPVERITTVNASTTTTSVEENEETLSSPAVASSGKSQIVALLLCWVVGIIGIHRFYLGYTWQGIVQILTLGGLGIWTLIDFIRIILGTLKPKDGEYSKTF